LQVVIILNDIYIYILNDATLIDLTISRKPKFIMLTIFGFETINKNTNEYKESSHYKSIVSTWKNWAYKKLTNDPISISMTIPQYLCYKPNRVRY
jgi:hypothetical protein